MIGPGIVKVAIPGATVALLATGSAVAFPEQQQNTPTSEAPLASSPLQLARETQTSRDAYRPSLNLKPSTPPAATAKPKAPPAAKHLKKQAPIPTPNSVKTRAAQVAKALPPKIVGSKFTTTDLNVWTAPQQKGTLLTVLAKGTKVSVTGEVDGQWAQIVRNGLVRWVKAEYLAATKPVEKVEKAEETEEAADGVSSAACKSGSGVEDGLTADAIRVHRAVCAAFPSVSSYGGVRSGDGGAHGSGRGLDIMVTGSLGDEIAAYVRSHAKELGVSEVIWEQRIWTVQRGSEGWRGMEDRGGATANHFDHVHVSVYGNAGTV
ncbi:SH3 type 3 domain protein [Kribbella flavida DSM 17836]|uniref:SH3 type 3 domain protein n=1 Tax=Kribbella flavida (strain DSM 17836 / JCM 10339 / NBRC 14399) TaxID=479435 RepID=D2PT53_KRIFD|nr:SH3 type 3 domain protein [Kribbella flavida DSM 17836]